MQCVWVAYVTEDAQPFYIEVPYQAGLTIRQAIQYSGIQDKVVLPEPFVCGIFGIKIDDLDHLLQMGDRVEIYRNLTINPKDIRRNRAKQNPVGRYQKSNRLKRLL